MRHIVLAALAATCLSAAPASAAIVTQTYNVTASGFGAAAPFARLTGSFRLTYDDATEFDATTAGLELLSLSFPADRPVQFASGLFSNGDRSINVGTDPSRFGSQRSSDNDDLGIGIIDTPTGAYLTYVNYSFGGGFYDAADFALNAVPEPATWGLMAMGFGLTGLAMRRRRHAPALA